MPAILVEVPAHVQHQTHVQNGVKVEGGSNWDLSRAALETPITALAPLRTPVPNYAVEPAAVAPVAVEQLGAVSFAHNSARLSASAQRALKNLKAPVVEVQGYASPHESKPLHLSQQRAEAVAAALEKKGIAVALLRAQGAQDAKDLKKSSAIDRTVRVTTPSESD